MVTLRISQQNFTWKGEKTILLDNLSAVSCHGIQSNFGKIHSRCPARQISSHSALFFFLFLNQPEFLYLQQAKKAAEEYQKYFPLHLPPWNRNWEANLGKRRRKRSPPGSPLLWKRPWIYCTLAPAADTDRRDRWKINTLRYKHLWRKKKKMALLTRPPNCGKTPPESSPEIRHAKRNRCLRRYRWSPADQWRRLSREMSPSRKRSFTFSVEITCLRTAHKFMIFVWQYMASANHRAWVKTILFCVLRHILRKME